MFDIGFRREPRMLDPVLLSRVQFALTIMFHYLFPPLTIGLGGVLVVLEAQHLLKKEVIYHQAARYWTRIFAVNFAMGVATGIVMEFQFGTNWATYSRFVGDVFGSALASEGIFAFFLESGFLAVLVFGWDRVSPRMHFFAACMVALGSAFSAVWIVVANSWQQTPAGFHLVTRDGHTRAEITDFWAMVFNPSSMTRLAHVLIGSFILGAFVVMSISAWYLLKGKYTEFARRSFSAALPIAAIFSILAAITGDRHGEIVAKHQPTKLAAMEGYFETAPGGAPFHLFGWPDEKEAKFKYAVEIPGGLSFLVHKNFTTSVPALDQFPRDQWPPVAPTFLSFHIMVGLGTFFIILTLYALYLRWKGRLFQKRWLMWVFVVSVLGPYIANQVGWITAEVGRQPWSVYGLLRTADSVSKAVKGSHVLTSIILFGLVYLMLFAVWVYVMNDKIQHGPELTEGPPQKHETFIETAARFEDRAGASLTAPEEEE
jgi:cytochrome d ubiquinol oxidase subunit I